MDRYVRGGDHVGALAVAPGGVLAFSPASFSVAPGVYRLEIDAESAGHTLVFDDPSVGAAQLNFDHTGTYSTDLVLMKAGDYTFYCALPGHRAAGMQGVIHVVAGAPAP